MSALKPCPFCGDLPKESIYGNTYKIECEGVFCGMAEIHGPAFDVQSSKEAWNNRPHENKIKREAFEAGFYESGDGFNGEWCGDKGEVSRLAQEYANKLERGES